MKNVPVLFVRKNMPLQKLIGLKRPKVLPKNV